MTGRILAAAMVAACLAAPAAAEEPAGPATAPPGADAAREEGRRHENALRHLLDTLEVVDTPVYSRNMLQLKYEWTARPEGAAMAQAMFKPVFAWGVRREFAVRVEVPVETVYPSPASGLPTSSGFASLTTTFFWAFYAEHGLRQAIGLELQWNTASVAAVGQPWIIEPIYGIGYRFTDWLGATLEVNWQKSFGNLGGYLPVNTIQFKPTVSVSLPAWFFVSVQDKTSWSIEDANVGSLLKFTAGRFLTATKSVVLAVEYETPLDPVAAQGTIFMVGAMLSYFYEW
jgi:hypothetical protein